MYEFFISIFIFVVSNIAMNKKLFYLFMCIGLGQINAQDANFQQISKWELGPRAGINLLPDFEDQLQNNFKIGLNGGLAGSYKFNKNLAIKMELNFTQKGKSYSNTETDHLFTSFNQLLGTFIDTSIISSLQGYVDDGIYSSYSGYHKLSYVEMPILAEASFYKFKFSAGPYIGLLIKSYTKETLDQNIPLLDLVSPLIDSLGFAAIFVNNLINTSFPGYRQTSIIESSSSSNFTKINYGFLMQLSYQIHPHTFLELSYSRALNSYLIDKSNKIQLTTFTLSLAYNFGLKKLKK